MLVDSLSVSILAVILYQDLQDVTIEETADIQRSFYVVCYKCIWTIVFWKWKNVEEKKTHVWIYNVRRTQNAVGSWVSDAYFQMVYPFMNGLSHSLTPWIILFLYFSLESNRSWDSSSSSYQKGYWGQEDLISPVSMFTYSILQRT
jgi:hypothetical protein